MPPLPPLYRTVAMSYRWFDSLPEAVQHHMLARARRRELTPGQRLYSRGDPPDGFYGVLEGSIRVSGIGAEGQEAVLDFYGPGSWFGEVSLFDGLPRSHDAHASETNLPTRLLQIAAADLEELLTVHPALSRSLLQLEALRVRILLQAIESYSTQSLEQRLANRLLMLAAAHGVTTAEGVRIELHLPQETLAQMIGATRQRVNQILKNWELDQMIKQQYGRILLLDQIKFENLAKS